MAKKYYAVRTGVIPGIYTSWDECKANVEKVTGAKYKSFKTRQEAQDFIDGKIDYDYKDSSENKVEITEDIYSFVDGSFNPDTKVYGCGGFLIANGERFVIQGSSNDELASMQNVAGEILGSTLAIKKAIELGLPEITIYYDYLGIEMWATDKWEAKKDGTQRYKEFIKQSRPKIDIKFKKVKGHSGIEGNEEADKLAKSAVGVAIK